VSEADELLFTEYLRENPALTAIAAWKKIYAEGKLDYQIATSSLSRIVRSHGLEREVRLQEGSHHILSSQGRIIKLYVDNGSTFVSNQTRRILDILQIHLIHSTPYRPQGRGKIERFNRTVRDGFLRPLDVQTITGFDDLNLRFRTWLEAEYHRTPHRVLTNHQTPLECWLEKAHHL
jgi:transposase InsO family protein